MAYQLGDAVLNPARRSLEVSGASVRIPARAMDLLVYLVENRDRPVTKDELLQAIWPGIAVNENNLNQCITALRKAFGDTRRDSRVISTIPNVGYQYVGPVEPMTPAAGRKPVRFLAGYVAAALCLLSFGIAMDLRDGQLGNVRIAVVTFQNLGVESGGSGWLSRALPEILTRFLEASGSRVRLAPDGQYQDEVVLSGSFARVGGTLRVRLALTSAHPPGAGRVWAEAEESGSLEDFAGIAVRAGRRLRGDVRVASSMEPMRLYSDGISKVREGDFPAAIASLGRGVALEPDNPVLLAALASAVGEIGRAQESRTLSQRAYSIANSDGVRLTPRERLEVEFTYWSRMGNWAKALHAGSRLCVVDTDLREDTLRLAAAQFDAHQPSEAARTLRALRLQDADPRALLLEGRILGAQGHYGDAVEAVRRSAAAAHAKKLPLLEARAHLLESGLRMNLGDLEAARALRARARSICEERSDAGCQATFWRLDGNQHLSVGRVMDAERSYRKALDLTRQTGRESELLNLLRGLAHISQLRGDFAAAEISIQEAIAVEEQANDAPSPSLLTILAESKRLQGDFEAAGEINRRAAALAKQTEDLETEAHAVLGLARADDAMAHYRSAVDLFRKLGNPEKLARGLIAYAQFLARQQMDLDLAGRLLDEASRCPHAPAQLVTLAKAQLARARGSWREAVSLAAEAGRGDSVLPEIALEAAIERADASSALGDTDGEARALAAAGELSKSWREPRLLARIAEATRRSKLPGQLRSEVRAR